MSDFRLSTLGLIASFVLLTGCGSTGSQVPAVEYIAADQDHLRVYFNSRSSAHNYGRATSLRKDFKLADKVSYYCSISRCEIKAESTGQEYTVERSNVVKKGVRHVVYTPTTLENVPDEAGSDRMSDSKAGDKPFRLERFLKYPAEVVLDTDREFISGAGQAAVFDRLLSRGVKTAVDPAEVKDVYHDVPFVVELGQATVHAYLSTYAYRDGSLTKIESLRVVDFKDDSAVRDMRPVRRQVLDVLARALRD